MEKKEEKACLLLQIAAAGTNQSFDSGCVHTSRRKKKTQKSNIVVL